MSAVVDETWLVDGFQDFAVDLAIARQQLQTLVLDHDGAVPHPNQRRRVYAMYQRLGRNASALDLTDVRACITSICRLLNPTYDHAADPSTYGRTLFAVGSRLDRLTRDVAMCVSQSSEWTPPPAGNRHTAPSDSQMLLDNGARAALELGQRLGRLVRVRVDQNPVTLPSLLLPVFHRMLLQLARNAVIHGIEDAIVRQATGKPATAVINVAIRTQGNLAVVLVKDDGRGIDVGATQAPAVPTPSQLWQAIAAPGYSSATEDMRPYAGRGVGLTAVQNVLERLGGHGEARTWTGHGTHIRVCVPTEP